MLLIFGPRKLPELGQTLGKAVKNFRDGLAGVENAKYKQLNPDEGSTGETAPGEKIAKKEGEPGNGNS